MTRPSLNQLAPTRTDDTLDRTFAVFYDGNANSNPSKPTRRTCRSNGISTSKSVLNAARCSGRTSTASSPTELEENVDIGVIGNIGGAGDAPLLYDVTRPINGDKAEVLGFEFGAQHFFDNGFGFRASYTYTDTEAYVDGVDVGPARRRVGVGLLGRADVRGRPLGRQLAADYSGEYTEINDAVGGLSQFAEPITWITASVAYQLTDGSRCRWRAEPDRRVLLWRTWAARTSSRDSRPGAVPTFSASPRSSSGAPPGGSPMRAWKRHLEESACRP